MSFKTFAGIIILTLICLLPCYGQIFYCGENPKQVALTFDDGPSFKYTAKVLEILRKENIKATFFIVGQKAEQYPEILREIAKEGNELGNHTYYHSRITTLKDDAIMSEIKNTSLAIKKITGKKVTYFRPPFGWFTKSERKLIESSGYKFVLWTVNADDFYHIGWGMLTPAAITKRVLRGVRGGDIILAHDDSEQLIEALPGMIEKLKERGYSFVTLSELMRAN